jgi:hypothetical protein
MACTAGGGIGNVANAGAAATPSVAGPSASSTPPPTALAHSNTETQVQGVDEADIVKTDGRSIYLIHGNQFLILDSWPATSLAMATSVVIEGEPTEMFVTGGQAVVFSRVDGTPIYTAANVTPRPAYSDVYSPGLYGGGVATGGAIAAPAAGGVGVAINGGPSSGYPSYANPLAKVTVLSLSGTQASVTRELYFEGTYLSSRRVDNRVRVILTGSAHGPSLAYSPTLPAPTLVPGPNGSSSYMQPTQDEQVAAWEALRATNGALIDQTTYADWVPSAFVKKGSQVGASPAACADFYIPTVGSTDFGVTEIESIDLNAPSDPPRAAVILGSVSTVYGNTGSLVLASEAYVDPWTVRQAYALSTPTATGSAQPLQPIAASTLNFTHLHLFDIASDPSTPQYVGSGTVPGDVKDQFALDERNGFVRVTTTEQRSGPPNANGTSNQVSHVFVLAKNRGSLSITGDAGEIAPGEQLYATRYVGDKAYVVTWHVTDPLFVIDVADPKHPHVLGQVQIPGFSTYIHPLDDTHLLTIGRETDATGHQHTSGGFWFGIAIQVFDVTNPLAPAQQYKYVYDGGEYATTEAMDNHKAFTYFDDKKLLAFPYQHQGSYGTSGPSSTLEVFQVGVAEGITKIGSVSHGPLLSTLPNGNYGYCGGYYDGTVRRGVFIENFVYSISYGGIIASDVSALGTPVSTLSLDAPTLVGVCR